MLLKKSKSLNIEDGKLHNSQENVVIDTCEDNDVERKDICAGSNTDDSSNPLTTSYSTKELRSSFFLEKSIFPSIYVEGPFNSPLQNVLNFTKSVCIAGGIGITPFASFINYFLLYPEKIPFLKLKRFELLWICRNINDIFWFSDKIQDLYLKAWELEIPDFFSFTFYITGKDVESGDSIDSKRLKKFSLVFHRPNMKDKFKELSLRYPRSKVGVFCCGPNNLISSVRNCCKTSYESHTVFKFHKESFS